MRTTGAILLAAVVLFPLTANAIDVSGDQWGTWARENSPYNVVGEIRVPPESTLVIEPGVVVDFQGHYKFIVDSLATLLAVGIESDSIYFTTEDTATGSHGIRFLYADSNSQISYCRLEYGNAIGSGSDDHGGAIYCYKSNPTLNSNTITNNSAVDDGGGIYCYDSDPTISNNTISDNSASGYGGGICCRHSNPTINSNTITSNSAAYFGGGIYCYDSDPTISHNTIRSNSASGGGGIYCFLYSNPTINSNTITSNFARDSGGGIYCALCSSKITDNTIRGNSANDGGGIHCYNSSPTINSNTIDGNWAYLGGGIYCWDSDDTISNNIISGNSAENSGGGIHCAQSSTTLSNNTMSGNSACYGGGIYCLASIPIITNTILWGDTAANGAEIYVQSGNPTVRYCDVQGGWEGVGNIDVDPRFRDPEAGDFHLMADYCGDPDNSPCIDVGHPDSLDALLDCFHGLGTDTADMGAYGGNNSGWPTGIDDDEDNIPVIPRQFLLYRNYPNPFNATTVIDYQLPVSNRVKLEIYNILGQEVATLVDEKQQAGYRSVIWDASDVSSGLYFYKLTAGEFREVKSMTLLK